MDKELFNSIEKRSEELKTWVPSNVLLEADNGTQIDLMDYITDGNAERKSWVLLQDNPKWNEPSSPKHREELINYINRACMKAGFAITVKEWHPNTKLRLRCSQNRAFKGKSEVEATVGEGEKQQRKTKTSKPICAADACPFVFSVYWFDEFKRWGLKAHSGKRQHCGHVHLEEDKTIRENLNKMMLDVWERAMAQYHEFVSKKTPAAVRITDNEYDIVSSRTAARGPQVATRLRRADSPRKNRKRKSSY
jgi:hypothetical protein